MIAVNCLSMAVLYNASLSHRFIKLCGPSPDLQSPLEWKAENPKRAQKRTRPRFLEAVFRVALDLRSNAPALAIYLCLCLFPCPLMALIHWTAEDQAFSPG